MTPLFSTAVRTPIAAGRFYPDVANGLKALATACLNMAGQTPVNFEGFRVPAVMAPHAGYVFSGGVAGTVFGQQAFRSALAQAESVLLLGPNHTGKGPAFSVWSGGDWQTPLGAVPSNQALARELVAANAGFTPDMAAHEREHSLEVMVPLLQVLKPDLSITAVTVGGGNLAELQAAGEALGAILRAKEDAGTPVLVVVSSDMSHYVPHDTATQLDSLALDKICRLDPVGLLTLVRGQNISMCGVLPMALALFALRSVGVLEGTILAYATSGQTGKEFGADMASVVGYAGVAFVAEEKTAA